MTSAGELESLLESLGTWPNHRDVERALRGGGWEFCGAGDWATALRSPDGSAVARVSAFDPVGPFTAALYREAAGTGQVPKLYVHRRLAGGGDLQLMEWLSPVTYEDAVGFWQELTSGSSELAALRHVLQSVHERAQKELPWCGPLDDNPSNIMRAGNGHLVLTDPFYADGPKLYAAAANTPEIVAARIPREERRFITEIPLAASGPWDSEDQEKIRAGLEAADLLLGRQ
ncbi:hypothetical protein AB0N65_15820 [Paenarthrobacter sp. NPDC089322]|uniref:hypothetical protein n=1 Tax=Paenarthrobacter sp. NPDC089322 TaxID=3155065 RepID=UPI003417D215